MNENLIQKFGMTEDKFLALELSYQAYFTYIIKYKLYYKLYFKKKKYHFYLLIIRQIVSESFETPPLVFLGPNIVVSHLCLTSTLYMQQ